MPQLSDIKAGVEKKGGTAPSNPPPKPIARKQPPKPPAAAAPASKVSFSSFEDADDKLNVMYYGFGGSGKTLATAAMAHLGSILYVNGENGLKKRPVVDRGIDISNIKVWTPTDESGEPCPIDYDSLDRLYWQIKHDLDDNPDAWAGVVWDSITDIHKRVLDVAVEVAVAKAERKGVERDPFDNNKRDEYGVMTEQMRQLVRRYRDLPCHFAITALERRDVDKETGHVERGPAVTPALQNDLYGYLDMVIHTDTIEVGGVVDYRGLTKPLGTYQAKDRFGVLPRYTIDVAFDRLVGYVTGDLDAKTDPIMAEAKKRHLASKQAAVKAAAQEESGDAESTD